MLRVWSVWGHLLVATLSLALTDFYTVLHQDYEFIYHDDNDLLLVIYKDNCYFIRVDDGRQEQALEDHSTEIKDRLVHIIQNHRSHHAVASTLDEVRTSFGDILADFHCQNRHIYQVFIHHIYDEVLGGEEPNHQHSDGQSHHTNDYHPDHPPHPDHPDHPPHPDRYNHLQEGHHHPAEN